MMLRPKADSHINTSPIIRNEDTAFTHGVLSANKKNAKKNKFSMKILKKREMHAVKI